MATEAELILKLTDQTQAGFKAVLDSMKGLQEQAKRTGDETKRLGDGIAGFGNKLATWATGFLTVKAASDLLIGSLKAQGEQEASINKLNLALANQGNLTQATSKALIDYADHLQATTIFSDDAVISAEAMLASFGMNEDQIKRTTKAAADFASATGKDLQTATDLLGKAFAGNTGALSRYGIVIDESIPKSERFSAALEQLEQRFGGSAEAATSTFGGAMAQLQNALGEVQEGIGKVIGTLFDSQQGFNVAVEAANRFANFLKVDVVLAISELRAQFAEMFADFLDIMGKIGQKFGEFADKIGADRAKLGLIIQATTGFDPNLNSAALKQAAEDQRRLSDQIRETGNQAAMSAGKTLEFTNRIGGLGRGATAAGKAVTLSFEEIMAAQKSVQDAYDELTKEAVDFNLRQTEILDELQAAIKKQAEDEIREKEEILAMEQSVAEAQAQIHEERMRALGELSDALFRAGEDVGGFLGSILQLGSAGIDVFINLQHQAKTTSERIAASANAINAAVGAFQSGSVMGGAGAGAAAGAAFGPLGAGIGALAGGLLGLFGGASKARKELEKLKDQVVGSFGSMQNFAKAAAKAGVDVSKAFSTKDPKEFKRLVDEANEAMEAQQKRIEGVKTAMGGLELMTKGFAAQMERVGVASEFSQSQFTRLGNFAVASFAGLVRETGDVIGALQQMGGSLDQLVALQQEFGFAASGAFANLLSLRGVVVANEDVAMSISGLNQLMKGLGDAGLITGGILMDLGAQASANFDELINRGVPANQALALMQPTLQELWEQQRRLGVTYDENTEKLLRQAEEQGLVGDQFLSTNEAMLEVLKILAETLGATLPAALRRMGDAAEHEFGRMGDAAHNAGGAIPGDFGGGGGASAPGFSREGFIPSHPPFGRHIRVSEDEGEFVLKSSTLARLMGSGGGGSRTIILQVGARQLAKVVEGGSERGDLAPKSRIRRAG